MMIFYSHLINGATLSISINKVLYRLTNEYLQTIEDRLCYIIVLIDSSNDITCNHKSIIYLRIKIDSPIVLIMKRLLSIDGFRKSIHCDPVQCTQCTRFFYSKTLRRFQTHHNTSDPTQMLAKEFYNFNKIKVPNL